jgi:mannose-6-phosphate isomerase
MLQMQVDNFVPLTRTPWAGQLIPILKTKHPTNQHLHFPKSVGETWEVSTEPSFPSRVTNRSNAILVDVLASEGSSILGTSVLQKYGNHCPLLLKWLHAAECLSVQLHPNHSNPKLKSNECGKPESWIVLDVEKDGFVYVGLKKGTSKSELDYELKHGDPDKCLHKVFPKPNDVISIPTGLVHATGPGVLIAEPQFVLPSKIGKTWRLSDWNRKYNSRGERDPNGTSRELHLEESWDALDWTLPQGDDVNTQLVHSLKMGNAFLGNPFNPFATQFYEGTGPHVYEHMIKGAFSLFTCVAGEVNLTSSKETITVVGGQSGLIEAEETQVSVELMNNSSGPAKILFFALNGAFV